MISTEGLPYPKPGASKLTLSPAQRKKKLDALYDAQGGLCAICGERMNRAFGDMRCATLDHRVPEPAGCAKNDADDNLQAACFDCNSRKGSRRV